MSSKGINIGHLNVQAICGENLRKLSELKLLLTAPENNDLHIFGLSETKLKDHKSTEVFNINGNYRKRLSNTCWLLSMRLCTRLGHGQYLDLCNAHRRSIEIRVDQIVGC